MSIETRELGARKRFNERGSVYWIPVDEWTGNPLTERECRELVADHNKRRAERLRPMRCDAGAGFSVGGRWYPKAGQGSKEPEVNSFSAHGAEEKDKGAALLVTGPKGSALLVQVTGTTLMPEEFNRFRDAVGEPTGLRVVVVPEWLEVVGLEVGGQRVEVVVDEDSHDAAKLRRAMMNGDTVEVSGVRGRVCYQSARKVAFMLQPE